ncbi:MAG: hypothetical protein HQL70_04575 [Magnetococcales bacterium]|nr:hypothetical protein [Magnetococcales bacterium]
MRGSVDFRSWWIGAIIWGGFSLTIINEHFRVSGGSHWEEMWFLCSLIWFQFGFARVLVSLFRRQYSLLNEQLLVALMPPVVLYFIIAPSVFSKRSL